MADYIIGKHNVGRIAERIVAIELEARGFRVSDLNKEGLSANADLLAAKNGKTWQIQVKGSTYDGSWFSYGYCSATYIEDKASRMFNHADAYYKASIVVLVCVRHPKEYECLVLPLDVAEDAARINVDREFGSKKLDGGVKQPGKTWVCFDYYPRGAKPERRASLEKELNLLRQYRDSWQAFTADVSEKEGSDALPSGHLA